VLRKSGQVLAELAEANVATSHAFVFRGPLPEGEYEVEVRSRGENGRIGESRTVPVRVYTFEDFRNRAAPVRQLGLGEVFPYPTDFDRDGIPEVLYECRDGADPYGTLTASELGGQDPYETFFAPGIRIYPVAVADVHGAGATDVLGLRLEQMRLYRGSGPVTFPDRLAWSDTTSGTWAAGIMDLVPDDGTMELVGLRGNDFRVYRESTAGARPERTRRRPATCTSSPRSTNPRSSPRPTPTATCGFHAGTETRSFRPERYGFPIRSRGRSESSSRKRGRSRSRPP
jgi:hypothetical protein